MSFCPLFWVIALSIVVGTGCSRPVRDEAANPLDHDEAGNSSKHLLAGSGLEDSDRLAHLFQHGLAAKQRELEESAEQIDHTRQDLERTGAAGLEGMDHFSNVVHKTDQEMMALKPTLDVLETSRQAQFRQMEPDRMSSLDSLHALLSVQDHHSPQPHSSAIDRVKAAMKELQLANAELALSHTHNAKEAETDDGPPTDGSASNDALGEDSRPIDSEPPPDLLKASDAVSAQNASSNAFIELASDLNRVDPESDNALYGESQPLTSSHYPPAYAAQPQGMKPYQRGYPRPPPDYGPPGYGPQVLSAYPQQYLAPQPASYVPAPPSYPVLLYGAASQNGVLQPGVPIPQSIAPPGTYPSYMPPGPGFQSPPMLGQYWEGPNGAVRYASPSVAVQPGVAPGLYGQPPEAFQQNMSSMAPMRNPKGVIHGSRMSLRKVLARNRRHKLRPKPSALLDEREATAAAEDLAQQDEEEWNHDHGETSTAGLGKESDAQEWANGVDPGQHSELRQKLKPKTIFKRTYNDQLAKMVDTSDVVKSKTLETISDLIGVHEKMKEWKANNLDQAREINSFHKDVNTVDGIAKDAMKEKEGESLASFDAINLNSFGTDSSTLKEGMHVDG